MIVVFLGPPGVGKGTQARLLSERHELEPVATGDMIRAEVARGSELGRQARSFMDTGNLVPDDLVLKMVEDRMRDGSGRGFLLDGFPRTVPQAEGLEAMLNKLGRCLKAVLHLVVPEEQVVGRLTNRLVCPVCNRVYNLTTQPSSQWGRCDDHPDAALIHRSDDDPELIRHRFQVYYRQTEPLVAWYRSRNLLREVDGTGEVDEVAARIAAALTQV